MKARRLLLNGAIGVAVVAVGAVAVTSIGNARTTTPVGQTVAVTRGTLVSTVSATGNVEAVDRVQVDLTGSGGKVTKIYVKQGDRVTKGDRLLKVDDSSQQRDLETARASLDSAEAKLKTTTQARTAGEVRQDNAAVADAAQSVRNAETTLKAARATYALDSKQQDAIVDDADDAADLAEKQDHQAKDALDQAEDQLEQDEQAGLTAAASADQSQVTTLKSTAGSAESALSSAESAESSAKRTRAATLLKDRQAIDSAEGQLASARKQLEQQRATAATNAEAARPGAVEDAQAQIKSAEVDVATAKQAVDDTVLTAPADGTVAVINAVVGESSAAASGGSGSGSSSSSSSGASGSAAGSSTSSTSASSSSGLVVLSDLAHKQILAKVAEVDVTRLKTGLAAQLVFPASGVVAAGTITAIDTEQTVTNDVVEYGVTIAMDTEGAAVKIGQTATVTITAQRKENVLIAPTSALSNANGQSTVTRRVNGVDTPVTVQTGLVGSTGTEITSGLAEGDQVVLPSTGGS